MMLPSTRKACVCVVVIALIISARSRVISNILLSRCWRRLSASYARRSRSYAMFVEYLSPWTWLRTARGFLSRCLHQSQVDQSPRPCTVAVCTSAQEFNIRALIDKLKEMRPDGNVDFQYVELPYNNLDSFRLDGGLYDGVILCHSIHNRRFSVTDVLDALYDRFLPYAASLFGKENVCVIVHDFPWPLLSSTTKTTDQNRESSRTDDHARVKEGHMESFQVRQPTTFKCCDLAMICGKLDIDVEMDNDDQQLIETFMDNVHQAYMILQSYEITNTHRKLKPHHVQIVRYVLPLVLGLYSVRFLRQIRGRYQQRAESTYRSRSAVEHVGVVHEGRGLEANIMCDEKGNERSIETDVEQDKSEVTFRPGERAILDVTPAMQDTKESIEPSQPTSSGEKQRKDYTDKPSNGTLELGDSQDTSPHHHMERALDQPPTGKENGKPEDVVQHKSKNITSPGQKQQDAYIDRSTDTSKEQENVKEIFLQHHMVRVLDIPPTLQDQQAMDTGHNNPRSSSSSEREKLEECHEFIDRSTKYKHSEDLDSYEETFIQHHRERALDIPPTLQEQYIKSSARSRSSHQKTQCLSKSKL